MIDPEPLIQLVRAKWYDRGQELGLQSWETNSGDDHELLTLRAILDELIAARDESLTRHKPQYPPIGSISEATMRPQDLIPKFMGELEYYAPEKAAELAEEFVDIFAALEWDAQPDFDDRYGWSTPEEIEFSETAGYLLEALFDALNEIAPPYTSFGSHEGDGACYGWWPDTESVEEDRNYGEILDVREDEDGNEVLYQRQRDGRSFGVPEYAAHVTDHGNVTLYRVKFELEEAWSVV